MAYLRGGVTLSFSTVKWLLEESDELVNAKANYKHTDKNAK